MPALLTRISSRVEDDWNSLAADLILDREARSRAGKETASVLEPCCRSSLTAWSNLALLRQARKILEGSCFNSWRAVSSPSPEFPPVMRMILPARLGISVSGENLTDPILSER